MRNKNNLDTTTKKVKTLGKSSQAKLVKKAKAVTINPVPEQPPTKKMQKESSKEEKHQTEFELKMKKVNDLITEGCIRQAYSAIPNEQKFPEQIDLINSMKSELMEKIWNL